MKQFIFILITALGCSCSNQQGNNQLTVDSDSVVTAHIPPEGAIQSYDKGNGPDGKALFKANCAACHFNSTKKCTGPGFTGVLDRVPSKDWLYSFVKNSDSVIKSGDSYANKLYLEYNKSPQPKFPQLSNIEIDAIFNYSSMGCGPPVNSKKTNN